jgi:hypothetical protein
MAGRSELAPRPQDATATQQFADVFCDQSRQRVEGLFHSLWHNTDSATYALVQDVLSGRHARLEQGVMDPSGEGPMVPAGTWLVRVPPSGLRLMVGRRTR